MQNPPFGVSETPRPGFEPGTCGLEVRCSIQLSYRGHRRDISIAEPDAGGYR